MTDQEKFMVSLRETVDASLKDGIEAIAGKAVAEKTKEIVNQLRLEKALFGRDISGISDEMKIAFVKDVKNITRGEKAALLTNSDTTGGYLVPQELHNGIMRIAASVGLVARDAQFFPMSTDSLDIPLYTGADLLGAYIGEDVEGTETSMSFGDAKLKVETWITIFRVGNTLLSDATVNVADWLLALAAEGLSARMDKEGFVGGTFAGSPFVGLLGSSAVTAYAMPNGSSKTTFASFTADEASDVIAQVKESILADCAFYFHRTVWAKIRQAKTANGMYTVGQNNSMIAANFKKYGIQPAGVLWDYPVYTSDYLPANSATAVSTKFGIFGNLKMALYVGDRGPVEIAKSDSATVGGKNAFATNQTAIRVLHRHAITVGLPAAAVSIATAAS